MCVVIAYILDRDATISNTRFLFSCGSWIGGIVESYDCVMTQPYGPEALPSPSSALLQLARLKAGMSQRELAERAGVPVTMISAYERDQRQPTLSTLLRLLRAAGFDLRLHLAAYDPHDDILAGLEAAAPNPSGCAATGSFKHGGRQRPQRMWRERPGGCR